MSDEAEEARLAAFMDATEADERDWIAFLEFEDAIRRAGHCAALVNPFDDPSSNVRERRTLAQPIAEMFFRALKRVSLGVLLANAEGIGYAIRFGIVEVTPDGLESVADDDALENLARRGDAAVRESMDEGRDEDRK